MVPQHRAEEMPRFIEHLFLKLLTGAEGGVTLIDTLISLELPNSHLVLQSCPLTEKLTFKGFEQLPGHKQAQTYVALRCSYLEKS